MARRPKPPGRAPTVLTPWPLDPPRHGDAHGPGSMATPPATAPGALRPTVRRFFCKGCRRGVDAADCPDQWLRVQLRDVDAQRRDGRTFVTVALFCGLPCLKAWATTTREVAV